MNLNPGGRKPLHFSSSFRRGVSCIVLVASLAAPLGAADRQPIYENTFQQAKPGNLPDTEFLILDGSFEIKQDGEQKFIELPGAPLDTFGVLFGPTQTDGVCVTARIHGTRQGRRYPTFAVGLNGAGGYRLQVSPAKKQLEILKGDEVRASTAFAWEAEKWTHVRLQVRKIKDGAWRVEGTAWTQGTPEPAGWLVTLDETEAPAAGRASLWGAPYATTPIRFDDLLIVPAQGK